MKYNYNFKWFVGPRITRAYILGVMFGDGCVWERQMYSKGKKGVKKNGKQYCIELHVKSKKFAYKFREALKNVGLRPHIFKDKNGYFRVRAYAKKFVESFKKLTFSDIEKILSSKKIDYEYELRIRFIRGFYESEGSFQNNKTFIYNSDFELINFIKKIIESLGFETSLYKQKRGYCLYIKNGLQFLDLIKPCIKGLK